MIDLILFTASLRSWFGIHDTDPTNLHLLASMAPTRASLLPTRCQMSLNKEEKWLISALERKQVDVMTAFLCKSVTSRRSLEVERSDERRCSILALRKVVSDV